MIRLEVLSQIYQHERLNPSQPMLDNLRQRTSDDLVNRSGVDSIINLARENIIGHASEIWIVMSKTTGT